MSVPASKKEKAKAEFITNGQHLLIDIGNWVDAQKMAGKTTGLDDFFRLASQAYIHMSFANNVKITNVDSYAMRTDSFRKAKSYYRSLREYLTVISTMYQIKKSRKKDWNNCLFYIDIELKGVMKSDLNALQTAVSKYHKTAFILKGILDEYERKQLRKRAKINRWKEQQFLKGLENGEITEPVKHRKEENTEHKEIQSKQDSKDNKSRDSKTKVITSKEILRNIELNKKNQNTKK